MQLLTVNFLILQLEMSNKYLITKNLYEKKKKRKKKA